MADPGPPPEPNPSESAPLQGLLTPWRLRVYSTAILASLAVAFIIAVSTGGGAKTVSGRLGGDFVTLYSSGHVFRDGDWMTIYNTRRHITAQRPYFPDDPQAYFPYAYPPFVAAAYSLLTWLPYRLAFVLHTLAMGCAVFGAIRLAARHMPWLQGKTAPALALALTYYPLHKAVGGGQNTPLTLFLFTAAWAYTKERRELLAGFCIGCLFYKPQLAVGLIGLFLIARRPRVLAGVLISGSVAYAVSALMCGLDWPLLWWREGVLPFQDLDQAHNAPNSVSWLGFIEAVLGVGDPVARVVGYGLAALTAAGLGLIWLRGDDRDFAERIGLAATGTVLITPHGMYYEAGLLVLALLAIANRLGARVSGWIAGIWAFGFLQLTALRLGFSLLFFMTVATLALGIIAYQRARAADLVPARSGV